MRNPFQLDFWSIFGPLRPLRSTAHGSKFEGFQVCKPRLKKDSKSRPGGTPFSSFFDFLFFFFRTFRGAKNPKLAIFSILFSLFFALQIFLQKNALENRKNRQFGIFGPPEGPKKKIKSRKKSSKMGSPGPRFWVFFEPRFANLKTFKFAAMRSVS